MSVDSNSMEIDMLEIDVEARPREAWAGAKQGQLASCPTGSRVLLYNYLVSRPETHNLINTLKIVKVMID
jgi:hypothetical protein